MVIVKDMDTDCGVKYGMPWFNLEISVIVHGRSARRESAYGMAEFVLIMV